MVMWSIWLYKVSAVLDWTCTVTPTAHISLNAEFWHSRPERTITPAVLPNLANAEKEKKLGQRMPATQEAAGSDEPTAYQKGQVFCLFWLILQGYWS